MTDLEQILDSANKAQGWCHLNKEIAILVKEVITLKNQVKRLQKQAKKVDDE